MAVRLAGFRPFRLLRVVRVLLLLGCCASASLVALLGATRARAGDVMVQVGHQLMLMPDASHPSQPEPITINGMTLMKQTGSSDLSPDEVVDHFRTACRRSSTLQLDERQTIALAPLASEGWFRSVIDGVFVERGEAGTAVVCIDPLGKRWDVTGIAEAAERFAATGELEALGQLRYAWVTRGQRGSVFLTFTTTGSTSLLSQFPRERDAPGFDFPNVKRAEGSQRYLSARLHDSQVVIYRQRGQSIESVAATYRKALEAGGYRELKPRHQLDDRESFAFERGRQQGACTIVRHGDLVLVTLLSQG